MRVLSPTHWRTWVALLLLSPIAMAVGLFTVGVVTEQDSEVQENIHVAVWTVTSLTAVVVSGLLFVRAFTTWYHTNVEETAPATECLVTLQNMILTGSLFTVHIMFGVVALVVASAEESSWIAQQITVIGLIDGQFALLAGGVAAVVVNQRLRLRAGKDVETGLENAVVKNRQELLRVAAEAREGRKVLEKKIDKLCEIIDKRLP